MIARWPAGWPGSGSASARGGVRAEVAGQEGHEGLIQRYGLRAIASGVAIPAAAEPKRHLGLRVAGNP
jgi:hypothetical protein